MKKSNVWIVKKLFKNNISEQKKQIHKQKQNGSLRKNVNKIGSENHIFEDTNWILVVGPMVVGTLYLAKNLSHGEKNFIKWTW